MDAGRPSYSPLKLQVANVGSPFELDINYTGRAPPSKFDWFKNGEYFIGDGNRTTTSHTGIIFTRVIPGDTGQYLVRASTPNAGETEASTTLKGRWLLHHSVHADYICLSYIPTVAFHSSKGLVQTGSSGLPSMWFFLFS